MDVEAGPLCHLVLNFSGKSGGSLICYFFSLQYCYRRYSEDSEIGLSAHLVLNIAGRSDGSLFWSLVFSIEFGVGIETSLHHKPYWL